MPYRIRVSAAVLVLTAALAVGLAAAARGEAATVSFPDSLSPRKPVIVRTALSAGEAGAAFEIELALRMRNYSELAARVARGDRIPYAELEEKYLPRASDYGRLAAWAESQGLTVVRSDGNRLGLFLRGSAAEIAAATGARFARIRFGETEATGAVTPPRLPAEFAPLVLAVNGLQPRPFPASPALTTYVSGDSYITPSDIAGIYGSSGSGLNGAGQTIAIIMDFAPNPSDLTTFWSDCQVPQSLSNFTVVPVSGGAASNGHDFEASLDVEWTSGLASAAKIRLYTIPGITSLAPIDAALSQIIQDLPANPGLHQVSISIGIPEDSLGLSQMQSSSQYFTVLASQGVTCFAGSGDGGSNPQLANPVYYDPNAPLEVSYPGSDPSVVAVGGTYLVLSSSNAFVSEAAWGLSSGTTYPDGHGFDATGGGYSLFPRPSWQASLSPPGPSGSGRCVPDVAAPAVSSPFGLVIFNNGQPLGIIGTSWSTPIWAAFCALLNQGRASASEPPLGLLAPKLYALPAAGNFRSITSGTNGAYSAAAGYNLCTGLGVPIFSGLYYSLVKMPTISAVTGNQMVAAGSTATFSVNAYGGGTLSYQWYENGAAIPGATSSTYSIPNVATNQGGTFTVTVSDAYGSVTSSPSILSVSTNARLANLSTRGYVGTGAGVLTAGFVISGSSPKQILLRGVGPTLQQFGVPGVLAQPYLQVYNSGPTLLAADAAWGGSEVLANAFAGVGAFPLPAASADSALLLSLAPGVYSGQISGIGETTGTALDEIYDADAGAPASRLVNISTRGLTGPGYGALDAGFVIAGTGSDTLVIRAVGPTLGQFGVAGYLANPQLAVLDSKGVPIATNTAWGGSAALAADFNQVGAFPLPAGSADSALVLTLPPGTYTAEVTGANNTSGIALVEIYEVPP